MLKPIIVIYNKSCENSPACRFAKENGLKAILCDNSTIENDNEKFAAEAGFTYIPMGGNKGLSKAYNRALEIEAEEDYYLILDDDTSLPENFIALVKAHIEKNPDAELLLPIVKAGEAVISPAVLGKWRVRMVRKNEKVKAFTAINSGMVVKKSLFSEFSYDENLFLEYIDHDLMCYVKDKNKKLHIMENIQLFQSFFGLSNQTREAALRRYNIFKSDFKYFVKKHNRNRFVAALIILKRKIAAERKK
ncbi:MAG: glycosyltransferase [Oscillospiraceae bacterium]|nr:glycosyltransferase [Oscillospiraceae bacterium]